MVELRGFEPLTPSMRTRCATRLRHSPKSGLVTLPPGAGWPLLPVASLVVDGPPPSQDHVELIHLGRVVVKQQVPDVDLRIDPLSGLGEVDRRP